MKTEIKTLTDAIGFLSRINPGYTSIQMTGGDKDDIEYLQNHRDLILISSALKAEWSIQQGLKNIWTPDWDDSNQYKYFCYFDMRGSGSGFAGTDYCSWFTYSYVGSRLCFPTEELALYFGKTFTTEHKIVMFEPKGWPVGGDDFSSTDEKSEIEKLKKENETMKKDIVELTNHADYLEKAKDKWYNLYKEKLDIT